MQKKHREVYFFEINALCEAIFGKEDVEESMQTPISNESPASQLSSCLAYYGYITYYLRQKCTSIRRGKKTQTV